MKFPHILAMMGSHAVMNPVAMVLLNALTGKYHPVLLREEPLRPPGAPTECSSIRVRSVGHVEVGLNTMEEAIAFFDENEKKYSYSQHRLFDQPYPWDGKGIPLISTNLLIDRGGKLRLM